MLFVFALTAGVLFAGGVYMMLRRSMVRLIIGLSMITYAINLMLFSMGDLAKREPPIMDVATPGNIADPLPQALILTAIVISFGATAFTITLAYRASQAVQTDKMDALRETESKED